VAVLAIGGIPEILASIRSGRIDGGILSPPTSIRAKKLGLHEFLDLGTLQIPFQQTTLITTERYGRSNPAVVRAYVKSFVEAIHLGKTNKSLAKRVISKYTKVTDDEILEETYQLFVVKYLKDAPYPSEAAIKTALDYVGEKDAKARTASPKDFVDPRWVKELEDSGYIANLYRK
jgi:ABC-type nitrate/sulfonate/bicarbonate transport system substrate-binding protein